MNTERDLKALEERLRDLGESFEPSEPFAPALAVVRPAGTPWPVRLALAAALVVAVTASSMLAIPALAHRLPVLPLSREVGALKAQTEKLKSDNDRLEDEVEQLKIEIRDIKGEKVPVVETAKPALPPEVNAAVQGVVMDFIKAQYDGDLAKLKSLSTPKLRGEIAKRPGDYLKRGGKVTFAQMTDVGLSPDGKTYLEFVRLSDAEFSDSQFQEDFEVKLIDGAYLVDFMGMDA